MSPDEPHSISIRDRWPANSGHIPSSSTVILIERLETLHLSWQCLSSLLQVGTPHVVSPPSRKSWTSSFTSFTSTGCITRLHSRSCPVIKLAWIPSSLSQSGSPALCGSELGSGVPIAVDEAVSTDPLSLCRMPASPGSVPASTRSMHCLMSHS